jgi:proteic killer suppression protein
MELRAADTLADISMLPPARCHGLSGDRAGQFAVDVQHPFRLIFEPAHDPVPRKKDGGIDHARVTAIRILEVTDYHG